MAVAVCCAGSTRCILKTLASESGAKILFTWTIHQIPVVAESLGGWKKLVSALARHTEKEEEETIGHLLTGSYVLKQKLFCFVKPIALNSPLVIANKKE